MSEKKKIILIYVGVAVISAAVIATSFWVRTERIQNYGSSASPSDLIEDVGKEEPAVLRVLEGDFEATNQDGVQVKISDLDGKVWVVNQFFANCPICVKQNSGDMIKLYQEFGSHPDFHMVSITVDPERDTAEKLHDYAQAVSAKTENWWFLTAEKEALYDYLSKEMKYTRVRENPDLVGAQRFAHDFGVQVYGRERRLVRTRDLVSGKAIGEEEHARRFEELRSRIAERLATPLEPRSEGGE